MTVQQLHQHAAAKGVPSHKSLDRLHSVPRLRPLALGSDREDEVVNSSGRNEGSFRERLPGLRLPDSEEEVRPEGT